MTLGRSFRSVAATASLVAMSYTAYRSGQLALVRLRSRSNARSATPPQSDSPPTLTIVIPARNEADRIAPTLRALTDTCPDALIIVVDDQSDDETKKIALDHGADVIDGTPLPDGWVGKPWALQQALNVVATTHLLTIDADARPKPGLVDRLLATLQSTDAVAACANGALRTNSLFHAMTQSSLLASLIYRFGPPATSPSTIDRRYVSGNGQCMLFDVQRFVAAGGFALSAGYMTDDLALVRALHDQGLVVANIDATDLLDVDMYDTARTTLSGWTRSLLLPGVDQPRNMSATVALAAGYSVAPWIGLATSGQLGRGRLLLQSVSLTTLALRWGVSIGSRRAIIGSMWGPVLAPLADPVTWVALLVARIKPQRSWKGRTYAAATLAKTEVQ